MNATEKEPLESVDILESQSPTVTTEVQTPNTLLTGQKLYLVFFAFNLSLIPLNIDQTILATALPTIASHFNAISDLSWIAGAYFLPLAAFTMIFGKILSISYPKGVLLTSIAIFEVGSLVCGVATSVNLLIFGRAVTGLGGAGIWVAVFSILARITTLKQRPIFLSFVGALYAICAIGGPLLGGLFADKVTWRWCFYLNLPIGFVAFAIVLGILPNLPPAESSRLSTIRRWMQLDWIGAVLSIAMVTMLVLALQWGGNTKPWNDPAVIASLVLFAVFLIRFVVVEYYKGDEAMLPLHLFKDMTMVGACVEGFMVNLCFTIASYYLPFLYQIKGHSASKSGLDIIPYLMSGVVSCIVCGGLVAAFGKPWPFLVFAPPFAAVAFGLLFSVSSTTSSASIAGYQILTGLGLGPVIQTVVVVVQVAFAKQQELIPLATAAVTFMQFLGSAIGLAATQAIFAGELLKSVNHSGVQLPPEVKALVLSNIKAVFQLPEETRTPVLQSYTTGVTRIFLLGVCASSICVFAALAISRKRIPPPVKS